MEENYIDMLLGKEGIKTDVTINIKTITYINGFFIIVGGIVVGGLLLNIAKKIFIG